MAYIPAQVSALLNDLTARLPVILGRNPVGVYLYGSLAQAAGDLERIHVDLIVVTRRDLSDAHFRRLNAWLAQIAKSNPCATRLQISFLIRAQVLTMNSRACL